MSNLIVFFLFFFLILFTIDKKPINILLDFIGIILSVAIFLITYNIIDISFISYVLIIIYGSAIVILFGFIIMLYNYSKSFFPSSIIKLFLESKNKEVFLSLIPIPFKNFILPVFLITLTFIIFNFLNIEVYNNIDYYYLEEKERTNITKLLFDFVFNDQETWVIVTLIINLLLIVMIGIIFLFN